MRTREETIKAAYQMRMEIEQLFTDAHHWNANVREYGESVIDPDPGGVLARRQPELDAFLSNQKAMGMSSYKFNGL